MWLAKYIWQIWVQQDEKRLKIVQETYRDSRPNVWYAKVFVWTFTIPISLQVIATVPSSTETQVAIWFLTVALGIVIARLLSALQHLEKHSPSERIEAAARMLALRTWRILMSQLLATVALANFLFMWFGYILYGVAGIAATAALVWIIYYLSVASSKDVRMRMWRI